MNALNAFLNKQRGRLLPAVLILFILEVVTFPFVLGFTWAGRSDAPERVLTYTKGKLTWDSADGIDENGAAELLLFDSEYPGVKSSSGNKIVAPGTESGSTVRLKNSVSGKISYTAVLYRIRSTDLLPVEAALSGDGLADTHDYTLPEGVTDSDVIRAVSGSVGGGLIQDFDIDWRWDIGNSEEQDIIDTQLGRKAAEGDADTVTIGLYIVVEDRNSYDQILPFLPPIWQPTEPTDPTEPSESGDLPPEEIIEIPTEGANNGETIEIILPEAPRANAAGIGIYAVLMCISGALLILLLWDRRKDRKCGE